MEWYEVAAHTMQDIAASVQTDFSGENYVTVPVSHLHALEIENPAGQLNALYHLMEYKWDVTGGVSFEEHHFSSPFLSEVVQQLRVHLVRINAQLNKLEQEMTAAMSPHCVEPGCLAYFDENIAGNKNPDGSFDTGWRWLPQDDEAIENCPAHDHRMPHDPACMGCEHDCPWKNNPMGAPFCGICDDHSEAQSSCGACVAGTNPWHRHE